MIFPSFTNPPHVTWQVRSMLSKATGRMLLGLLHYCIASYFMLNESDAFPLLNCHLWGTSYILCPVLQMIYKRRVDFVLLLCVYMKEYDYTWLIWFDYICSYLMLVSSPPLLLLPAQHLIQSFFFTDSSLYPIYLNLSYCNCYLMINPPPSYLALPHYAFFSLTLPYYTKHL